jgi:hypothetical protein
MKHDTRQPRGHCGHDAHSAQLVERRQPIHREMCGYGERSVALRWCWWDRTAHKHGIGHRLWAHHRHRIVVLSVQRVVLFEWQRCEKEREVMGMIGQSSVSTSDRFVSSWARPCFQKARPPLSVNALKMNTQSSWTAPARGANGVCGCVCAMPALTGRQHKNFEMASWRQCQ